MPAEAFQELVLVRRLKGNGSGIDYKPVDCGGSGAPAP